MDGPFGTIQVSLSTGDCSDSPAPAPVVEVANSSRSEAEDVGDGSNGSLHAMVSIRVSMREEILAKIMLMVVDYRDCVDPDSCETEAKGLIACSQLCSCWRGAALAFPELWGYIGQVEKDSPLRFDAILRRARYRLISVVSSIPVIQPRDFARRVREIRQNWEAVFNHFTHCEYFFVRVGGSFFWDLLSFRETVLEGRARNLKSLTILQDVEVPLDEFLQPPFNMHGSPLEAFQVRGAYALHFARFSQESFPPRLMHLHVHQLASGVSTSDRRRFTPTFWLRLLQSLPLLHTLTLCNSVFDWPPPGPNDGLEGGGGGGEETVRLSRLTAVKLVGGITALMHVMKRISFPPSCKISVAGIPGRTVQHVSSKEVVDMLKALLGLVKLRGNSLTMGTNERLQFLVEEGGAWTFNFEYRWLIQGAKLSVDQTRQFFAGVASLTAHQLLFIKSLRSLTLAIDAEAERDNLGVGNLTPFIHHLDSVEELHFHGLCTGVLSFLHIHSHTPFCQDTSSPILQYTFPRLRSVYVSLPSLEEKRSKVKLQALYKEFANALRLRACNPETAMIEQLVMVNGDGRQWDVDSLRLSDSFGDWPFLEDGTHDVVRAYLFKHVSEVYPLRKEKFVWEYAENTGIIFSIDNVDDSILYVQALTGSDVKTLNGIDTGSLLHFRSLQTVSVDSVPVMSTDHLQITSRLAFFLKSQKPPVAREISDAHDAAILRFTECALHSILFSQRVLNSILKALPQHAQGVEAVKAITLEWEAIGEWLVFIFRELHPLLPDTTTRHHILRRCADFLSRILSLDDGSLGITRSSTILDACTASWLTTDSDGLPTLCDVARRGYICPILSLFRNFLEKNGEGVIDMVTDRPPDTLVAIVELTCFRAEAVIQKLGDATIAASWAIGLGRVLWEIARILMDWNMYLVDKILVVQRFIRQMMVLCRDVLRKPGVEESTAVQAFELARDICAQILTFSKPDAAVRQGIQGGFFEIVLLRFLPWSKSQLPNPLVDSDRQNLHHALSQHIRELVVYIAYEGVRQSMQTMVQGAGIAPFLKFISEYHPEYEPIISTLEFAAMQTIGKRRATGYMKQICDNLQHSNLTSLTPRARAKACTGCGTQIYCSVDCQEHDWESGHGLECEEVRGSNSSAHLLSFRKRMELLMFIEDTCNYRFMDALAKEPPNVQESTSPTIFALDARELPLNHFFVDSSTWWTTSVASPNAVHAKVEGQVRRYIDQAEEDPSIKLVEGAFKHGLSIIRALARVQLRSEADPQFYVLSAVFSLAAAE
ncbi:hypothetical protein MD484_g3156, partial [Candolleomyces efflorescens]